MLNGLVDPSRPGMTILGGVLLLLLSVACFLLKFSPKWKQWGHDWRAPIWGFGGIVGLLGSVNILVGIKMLLKATGNGG